MNPIQLLRRYSTHVLQGIQNPSQTFRFHKGNLAESSHLAYIRQLRAYFKKNPERLPSMYDRSGFLAWVDVTSVWIEEDYIYIGPRNTWKDFADPTESQAVATYAAVHNRPLTTEELQALFYCYQHGLIQTSIRINSNDQQFLTDLADFRSKCPDVGVVINSDHVILI